MDNDDVRIGRLLTRREILALLGATGAAQMTASRALARELGFLQGAMPQCVVVPEQMEGPYFVDEKLNRSDIRSEPGGAVKPGIPLRLRFNISEMKNGGGCTPLANAQVDVWQCDAGGVYSDAKDEQFNTIGQKFLRGYQRSDAQGVARFTTIYPGWYRGRAVHVHFKIRTDPAQAKGYEFTSQLYFDDALSDKIHARPPYAQYGPRNQRNAGDSIFRNENGDQLIMPVTESKDGFDGVFNVALNLKQPTRRGRVL